MADFGKYKIGFFSMEVGIENNIPTYAGGLGVLAGDALRSCADLNLPVIGVTMIYKKGYFKQKIEDGEQKEEDQDWNPYDHLKKLDTTVKIKIGEKECIIGCWMYTIEGMKGRTRIIFLDTDLNENEPEFREITQRLYQGDEKLKICQAMVLGIGGVRMLQALGCNIRKYHMNEGHSSMLALALCRECTTQDVKEEIREQCVFTTHTPVPAGHDKFDRKLVEEMAGEYLSSKIDIFTDGKLNMTELGLRFSGFINGVARRHMQTAKQMFPNYLIEYITNGIHSGYWTNKHIQRVFNDYLPSWREDPFGLRSVMNIPEEEIYEAHKQAKKELLQAVKKRTGVELDESRLTIGFARRFVEYKRPGLILSDLKRLDEVKDEVQIIFSGKAHPDDTAGKRLLKETLRRIQEVKDGIKVVFLENYDMEIAKLMVAGCDIWLNNPRRPYEASGTSGMKAAINGVPHFSTLDGWWLEGHIEGVTGWCIGLHPMDEGFDKDESPDDEAEDFYKKLINIIVPTYKDKEKWMSLLRTCIAINGSFFNTHRMMEQYFMDAYRERSYIPS